MEFRTESAMRKTRPQSLLPFSSPTTLSDVSDHALFKLPQSEVARRLREQGQPVRLFGETDREVCLRLRQLELLQETDSGKGLRNDFQDAMEKIDQEYLDDLAKEGSGRAEAMDHDDGTTYDQLQALAAGLDNDSSADTQAELVLKTLQFLLRQWAQELNSQPDTVKRAYQGKIATATHRQTETYLKPLFKQLKRKSVPPEIALFLSRICQCLLDRDYVKANDVYLEMAIGNAPWPIGVTMVGIHARTGREKIFAQNVAHVLNDETQRKYIQAVKRLMTACQKQYPTDPSRSVEYQKP